MMFFYRTVFLKCLCVATFLFQIVFIPVSHGFEKEYGIVVTESANVHKEKSITSTIVSQLGKGDEFQILKRDQNKTDVNGLKNYWYDILLKNGRRGWIFGSNMQRKPTSGIDCDAIYRPNNKSFDPDEYNHFYPFQVSPVSFVPVIYLNSELSELIYQNVKQSDIAKIEVVGRRQRGLPIFNSTGYIKQSQGFVEVYKVKVTTTDLYIKKNTAARGTFEGYMTAEDVLKKDDKIVSPRGRFTIWKNSAVNCIYCEACGGDYINRSLYFLEVTGAAKYLGYEATFAWAPNDDYFLATASNHFESCETAIYDRAGNMVWKSGRSLTVAKWFLDKKIVFLKTISYEGELENFFALDLYSGKIRQIVESDMDNWITN